MEKINSAAIFGFGDEGREILKFLKKINTEKIGIFDESKKQIPEDCLDFTGEKFDEKRLLDFEITFRSPGVNPKKIKNGMKIETSLNLFLKNFEGLSIGITGSNGKTTTTELIFEVLKKAGKKVIRGGNDGKPLLQELIKKNPPKIAVLELSSFQLMDAKRSPNIACITNISPNHLDWHLNLEEYENSKKNIIKFQRKSDFLVLNFNDAKLRDFSKEAKSNISFIGKELGENFAINKNGKLIFYRNKIEVFDFEFKKAKAKTHPDNFLIAGAVALLCEIPREIIEEAFYSFKGASQRIEFVRKIKDKNFYNDSSSTTPESSELAIRAFPKNTVTLLLGGKNKGMNYLNLAKTAKEMNAKTILFGQSRGEIAKEFEQVGNSNFIIYKKFKDFNFNELLEMSRSQNRENILFSPGCASFDLFENAKKRGKLFKEIVGNIK